MEPEEIVTIIAEQNRDILADRNLPKEWTVDEILGLMNIAAMRGFRFGSESALSMVKSKLVVKYLSEATANEA
jgi:hypothetical protein